MISQQTQQRAGMQRAGQLSRMRQHLSSVPVARTKPDSSRPPRYLIVRNTSQQQEIGRVSIKVQHSSRESVWMPFLLPERSSVSRGQGTIVAKQQQLLHAHALTF
jgi:hypothetical protein